jgi:putative phosphoesterase
MRVALIGDVHANLPALAAVLEHARQHRAYEVWGVGDWVGLGDLPEEVVQSLQQHSVRAIAGNYDLSVLKVEGKRAGWGEDGPPEDWQPATWAYDHLSESSRAYLRSLPPQMRMEVQGRRILLTHASPASPKEALTSGTPLARLRELAQVAAADVVLVGHAHVPMARKVGGVWFINTGSVGQPRDDDPRACYAILTLGRKRVQVRHYRVDYRMEKALVPAEPAPATAPETAVAADPLAATSAAAPAVPEATEDEHLQAVLQLAKSCEYEEQHTHQVTRLALRLFDELKLVHGLGPRERYWLQCGALLHDIGLIEGVQGHHKASLRIILDTPLLKFDKKERLIIGSIARYHRAGLPQERHHHFAALKPGLRRIVRTCAAILRVADGLDYTHQNVVSELSCVLSPKQIVIRCAVKQPAEDERLRALEKGDLLREVFERDLLVECQQ